jgi:hypothetical protein
MAKNSKEKKNAFSFIKARKENQRKKGILEEKKNTTKINIEENS